MKKSETTFTCSCILLLGFALVSPLADRSSMNAIGLRCEYAIDPVVVAGNPRFSWLLESPERGAVQQAYQLLVASSMSRLANNLGDIWDSGRVESSQSTHVPCAGRALESNNTYYWKVRVWDRTGAVSTYSDPATFSMGLLAPDDWKAEWIGRGSAIEPRGTKGFLESPAEDLSLDQPVDHDGRSTLLRKEFKDNRPIRRARVHVSGLGFYELHVNGGKVGGGVLMPAKTNYRKQVLYNTYDVTDRLKTGANAIAIMLGNGWFNPYKKWWSWRMQWFGSQRASAQLHIEYSDGTSAVIATDATWKASTGAVVRSCVYDGETYDANLELPGWDAPDFDDSSWENANVVQAPGGKMMPQMMESIQVTEILAPVKLTNPEADVWVFDMGQNFAGWARLVVQGPKETKVRMRYAENIGADGMIDRRSMNLAEAAATYILKGEGTEVYEPRFAFYGFRYVEVTGFPGTPTLDNLQGSVVHSACEPAGSFECGNELINKIHRATLWSQRSNMVGYPMDCPQRDERLGWMGDAHVTAEEAMLNFHMPLFYANWLSGIQSNQNQETGDIPYISPRPFFELGDVAWSSAYNLIVWYHYLHYGDVAILSAHFESLKKYVDFLVDESVDFILPRDKYGDWLSVSAQWQRGDPEGVPTAYLYYNAALTAKIAKVLANKEDAQRYAAIAARVKESYNRRFFDAISNQYGKGSQCSNAFPLFLGLVPAAHRYAVLGNLVNNILVEEKGHLTTGILGTKYMMEALSQEDRSDVAYLLAAQTGYPSWGNLIEGRTTLSEYWNQTGSNNHVMFGSVDTWFYRVLAGINSDQSHPGFKHCIIKPFVHPELGWAAASVETVMGRVSSKWQLEGGVLKLEATIPANTSAHIHLLARSPEQVTEGGEIANRAEGVEFLRMEGRHAVFAVGSGAYRFISQGVADLVCKPFVAKPEIVPTETFIAAPDVVTVQMSSPTGGADIRFTLDGSVPTELSRRYRQPFKLTETTTVKAKAFKEGCQPSVCGLKEYTFVDPEKNGLNYQLYHSACLEMPNFDDLTVAESGRIYQFGLDGVEVPEFDFLLRISGHFDVAKEGEYTFYTLSNDGSQLFIDDRLVVDNDGHHLAIEKCGKSVLSPGLHSIVVTYFQTGGGKELTVFYAGPGIEKQKIPVSNLFYK
jgi:alpha-L-rhamnosidase